MKLALTLPLLLLVGLPLAKPTEASENDQPRPISLEELVQSQARLRADDETRRDRGDDARGPVRAVLDAVIGRDGRLRFLAISVGDLLDLDDRAALVPAERVTVEMVDGDPEVFIDLTLTTLGVLPGYELDVVREPGDLDEIIDVVDNAFRPASDRAGDAERTSSEPTPDPVPRYMLASRLMDIEFRTGSGECGQVEDASVDLSSLRLTHLLVGDCVQGLGSMVMVVPTEVIRWEVESNRRGVDFFVRLPVERRALRNAVLVQEPSNLFLSQKTLDRADRFFGIGADSPTSKPSEQP